MNFDCNNNQNINNNNNNYNNLIDKLNESEINKKILKKEIFNLKTELNNIIKYNHEYYNEIKEELNKEIELNNNFNKVLLMNLKTLCEIKEIELKKLKKN